MSQNTSYRLVMQGDGNLVEYGPSGWMWSSNTVGSGGANRLVMPAYPAGAASEAVPAS